MSQSNLLPIEASPSQLRQCADSDADLEDFFENAAVGLHIVGADGRIQRANRAELDLLGYSAAEYLGRPIAEFHVDADVIADILARLTAGQKLEKYPARLRAKDGSIKHVLITSSAKFQDGRFASTRCFTVDVTETHQASRALHESEGALEAIYESAPVGIGQADASGRFVRVNNALLAITGYERDELIGRSFAELTDASDRERDLGEYSRQVAGEIDCYTVEKRYIRKDGRRVDVEVSSSSVRGRDGSFLYGVRVVQDVSERKAMERRLLESERMHRDVLEALPAAIYTTDTEGKITFYNRAAVDFSGRRPEIGEDSWCVSWRLFRSDGSPLAHDQCPMAITIRSQAASHGEVEAIAERPDGTRAPFTPYATPLFDSDGAFVGAVNMLLDITERKRAEERLRLLIDELNHRVKNTLATVQSIAAQTLNGAGSLVGFRDKFESRLMALSKAHDLLTRSNWEGADLGELLTQVLVPFGRDRTHLDGPSVRLSASAALMLSLVFHELATNAAKYGALSAPGGLVSVRWNAEDGPEGLRSLDVHWQESGGPEVIPSSHRGFGTRLIERGVTYDLGGQAVMDFAPAGLQCRIEAPLTFSPA